MASATAASFATGPKRALPTMAAKLEKTRTPGIYRHGGRYVVVYNVGGRRRREPAPYELARKLKAELDPQLPSIGDKDLLQLRIAA